jgi:Reverse transcriptase (RNA-dependent DNA polymerase)
MQQPFTQDEIEEVIKGWPRNKAPGPDGFTGEFFKKFKNLLMPDLLQVINSVAEMPQQTLELLNSSHIALVPKKKEASKPSDFRPISLVSSVQKVFSKLLACCLQKHMGQLLTETQTGVHKGCSILHGFHYAQELIGATSMQKTQIALFKADIHKTFDSIEWPFITNCFEASGFPEKIINWIYFLMLQGSSKVLIN